MNELALFPGAGGGLLGSAILGWRPICGVELSPFCRQVLFRRQSDGCLPKFPIWDDIRTFDGRPWRGRADIVSGGFPCQAFSKVAHGGQVATDLWPEMLRVIREVQPAYVFAENVIQRAIQKAAEDLAEEHYVVNCARISAASVGAPTRRTRYWLVAHSHYGDESPPAIHAKARRLQTAYDAYWQERPDVATLSRGAHGLANRMDRLRVIGNGQIPAVVVLAWTLLSAQEVDDE